MCNLMSLLPNALPPIMSDHFYSSHSLQQRESSKVRLQIKHAVHSIYCMMLNCWCSFMSKKQSMLFLIVMAQIWLSLLSNKGVWISVKWFLWFLKWNILQEVSWHFKLDSYWVFFSSAKHFTEQAIFQILPTVCHSFQIQKPHMHRYTLWYFSLTAKNSLLLKVITRDVASLSLLKLSV